MTKEYGIVRIDLIRERIKELDAQYFMMSENPNRSLSDIENEREVIGEQRGLSTVLSEFTPLTREIEKAFDAGFKTKAMGILMKTSEYKEQKKNYINKLNDLP